MTPETARRLREYAAKYEKREFIFDDPSQFIHCEGSPETREATAFVASSLSFGDIKQFVPKIKRLYDLAGGDLDGWIRSRKFRRAIPDTPGAFYRFVTWRDLRAFLERYADVMRKHGTLGGLVEKCGDGTGAGAVKAICAAFDGSGCGYLVPKPGASACKRICLFLRWMVRTGSPVDLGLWSCFIDRRTLLVPLDTHVVQEARLLGLPVLRSASMRSAALLTAALAEIFPDDPLKGDFALFGHHRETSLK